MIVLKGRPLVNGWPFIIHSSCELKYLALENYCCTFAMNLVSPPQAKN